jgi:hypothetical protein
MKSIARLLVSDPTPTIASVAPDRAFRVHVAWNAGSRAGSTSIVDLAPLILSRKVFAPLRRDEALFNSLHPIDDGHALAWGDDDQIDIAATTVERLAEQTMTPADFAAFLRRNSLSLDAAAALLGLGRRVVAYYAKDRAIPRHIALACLYIEQSQRGDYPVGRGKMG